MKPGTTLVAACLMFGSVLSAEWIGPTPTPATAAQVAARRVASLTRLLSLTASQQTQATAIFTTEETALETLGANLIALRASLEAAIEANNAATIQSDAAQAGSLITQEVQDEAQADAAFYALLTSAQQTIFKQLLTAGFVDSSGLRGFGGGRP